MPARLLPVILLTTAAMMYVFHVEGPGMLALANALPMLVVVLLALGAGVGYSRHAPNPG